MHIAPRSPLLCLLLALCGTLLAEEPFWFGDYRGAVADLAAPSDVAVDAQGRIVVANAGAGTVEIRAADGALALRIADLLEPSGLAFGASELYVADRGRDQIAVYDQAGKRLRAWGRPGKAPGQLHEPTGLAVQGERVYVADAGNHRVQAFDRAGTFLFALDPGPRPMKRPEDVLVAPDGSLFVADTGNHRILVTDAAGKFLRSWGDYGVYPGLFDTPSCLLWSAGRLLVVDQRNHRIQAFAPDGAFLGTWGQHEILPHEGQGKLHYPVAAAIDPQERFAVVCEAIEDRVQILARDPKGMSEPDLSPARKRTHFGRHLAIDQGILAVAEPEAHFVLLYDLRHDIPININKFGERGEQFGLMLDTSGVWLDVAKRRVLTSDLLLGRIQEYHMDFEPGAELKYLPEMTQFAGSLEIETLTKSMPALEWPIRATALVGGQELHLIDTANARIHVFDQAWHYRRSYGGPDKREGALSLPQDLVLDPKGKRAFVVDGRQGKVVAFDRRGKVVQTIGAAAEGRLGRPFGIARDSRGNLYVSDSAAHRIVTYDKGGRFVRAFGTRGDKMGQLWYPAGLAIDDRERLIVVDYGNHRIQIFDLDGTWRVTLSAGRAYTWKNPPASTP